MKSVSLLFAALLIVFAAGAASAQTPIGGEAVSPAQYNSPQLSNPQHTNLQQGAQNRRHFPRTRSIVDRYIQEKIQAGELDPTEYNQLKEQRQILRSEIQALRQAGDADAVAEKMESMRALRTAQQNYLRDFLQDNPDLQQQIRDQRLKARQRQLERRRDLLERRLERLQDRELTDRRQ